MSLSEQASTRRGTILRGTEQGDGLVSVAGKQHAFSLESHWLSERPPVTGAKVDVSFTSDGALSGVMLVSEADLARELAGQASDKLQKQATVWFGKARLALGDKALIALITVWVGWFALDQVSLRVSGLHTVDISMWQLLTLMNAPDVLMALRLSDFGAGVWGGVMALAAVAPLLPAFWQDRRAHLGLVAPLLFTLAQPVRFYLGVRASLQSMQGGLFGSSGAGSGAVELVSNATSFNAGFYIAIVGGAVLAVLGVLRYLSRAN